MEKQQARLSGNSFPIVSNSTSRAAASGDAASRRLNRGSGKTQPSRDAIARCIHIWAAVYRLYDDDCAARELQMPPRAWSGKSTSRLDRFG